MENASKALLMAAGVLIGILLISFMVLILRKGGQLSAEYDSQLSDNELLKFNSQFELYNEKENTFFNIITLVNLAYDVNTSVGWEAGNGVTIQISSRADGTNVQYEMSDKNPIEAHKMSTSAGRSVDIYNDLVKTYAQLKEITKRIDGKDVTQEKYQYNFPCVKVAYNTYTGKVNEMVFWAQEVE